MLDILLFCHDEEEDDAKLKVAEAALVVADDLPAIGRVRRAVTAKTVLDAIVVLVLRYKHTKHAHYHNIQTHTHLTWAVDRLP